MIYAVNKRTKEHHIFSDENFPKFGSEDKYYAKKADANGWIDWSGGECPLPVGAEVDIKAKDARCPNGENIVTCFASTRVFSDWVIAYRPVIDQPASEEVKGWRGPQDGLPPIGLTVEVRRNDSDWREAVVVGHDGCRVIVRMATESIKYDWAVGGGIRPLPTPREQWVEKALGFDCEPCEGMLSRKDFCGELYDALASGELEVPERH